MRAMMWFDICMYIMYFRFMQGKAKQQKGIKERVKGEKLNK